MIGLHLGVTEAVALGCVRRESGDVMRRELIMSAFVDVTMEFGFKPAEGGQRFDSAVTQAQAAEEYGFETLYLSEHSGFPDGGYWPHPILALAGFARETETVELSSAVSLLPLTNPVELAGELALLDVISGGRTRLGFGAGWREVEFDAFDVPYEERHDRMDEYLEILTSLLEGGSTSFDGDFYQFEDFELSPRPVQTPRPPIMVGGVGRPAVERAVEYASGWLSLTGELDEVAEHARHFRDAGVERVVVNTEGVIVREDARKARETAKRFLRAQQKSLMEESSPHSGSQYDREAELDRTLEHEFEEYICERMIAVGTPDECIEQFRHIQEATGCDQVLCRVSTVDWPHEAVMETLDLLGTDVLPSF